MDVEWTQSPIIRFDLGQYDYRQPNAFECVLDDILRGYEKLYGCESDTKDLGVPYRLSRVLKAAYNHTGQGVVVLIDDMDKPMLDVTEDMKLLAVNEGILKKYLKPTEIIRQISKILLPYCCRMGHKRGFSHVQDKYRQHFF